VVEMLREAGAHFGTGCGGASIVSVLAERPDLPLDLSERLARSHAPIACVLREKEVELRLGGGPLADGTVAVSVRVGRDVCRLRLSSDLLAWLQEPLGLEGALIDEEAPQRALLLELAGLDLLRMLESQLGEDIRFSEDQKAELPHILDLAILADERVFRLGLELPLRRAEAWADFIDRIQPRALPDFSGITAEVVIEAGSQDITIDELESLRPGDVIMLATHRPVVVVDGKLIAPVRRRLDSVELDGPFYPRARRAMPNSLFNPPDRQGGTHILHMAAEFARTSMTLGEIDALQPRHPLPLSFFDETVVDIVIDGGRVGRGELVIIGAGMGVRIVHLLPAASA
jgi:type III secretion protein Q